MRQVIFCSIDDLKKLHKVGKKVEYFVITDEHDTYAEKPARLAAQKANHVKYFKLYSMLSQFAQCKGYIGLTASLTSRADLLFNAAFKD